MDKENGHSLMELRNKVYGLMVIDLSGKMMNKTLFNKENYFNKAHKYIHHLVNSQ